MNHFLKKILNTNQEKAACEQNPNESLTVVPDTFLLDFMSIEGSPYHLQLSLKTMREPPGEQEVQPFKIMVDVRPKGMMMQLYQGINI